MTIPDASGTPEEGSAGRDFLSDWFGGRLRAERVLLGILLALAVMTWIPRLSGPIDLRWDGGVYYILGTSIAEGKGYKLLNEPGEIDAVQYPPLLPSIIAVYQLALGTDDPTTVGRWLRFSAAVVFLFYVFLIFRFLTKHLPLWAAFLGSVLCLFSLHVYFLSDLCFPEILFGLLTLLFVLSVAEATDAKTTIYSYLLAVASFLLRTVGLAAFAAWFFDSLFRRRFKQAILRAMLILLPILGWQFYIFSVESSAGYRQPSYLYQRAPYMFYNVTYARNISLEDPFAPEKGPARSLKRLVQNAVLIPASIGESISTLRGYWKMAAAALIGQRTLLDPLVFVVLYGLGLCAFAGISILLWRPEKRIIAFYTVPYIGALCLTPFPEQYSRYLMPVTPFLVLGLFECGKILRTRLKSLRQTAWLSNFYRLTAAAFAVLLLVQFYCLVLVFRDDLEPVAYLDRNGRAVKHRLFFYQQSQADFDACIGFLRERSQPSEISASGMPHWVFLRTGLKAVMPPFEIDPAIAQNYLDSVPVKYLVIGRDVIRSERYTLPVVERFSAHWRVVYAAPGGIYRVYERTAE